MTPQLKFILMANFKYLEKFILHPIKRTKNNTGKSNSAVEKNLYSIIDEIKLLIKLDTEILDEMNGIKN